MANLEERIIELEILLAHQQRDLEALNGELVHAHRQLDAVTLRLGIIENVIRSSGLEFGGTEVPNEKPPHF